MTIYEQQERTSVAGLVLAGGRGKRMGSHRPKVLMSLLGEPMLYYVYQALSWVLDPSRVFTVVGYKGEQIQQAFPDSPGGYIWQEQQLGTGHALQCAHPQLSEQGFSYCLVVSGDIPLLTPEPLSHLIQETQDRQADLAFLTMHLADPSGYGRVLRGESGRVEGVVEDRDLEASQRQIKEVNTGIYCLRLDSMAPYLRALDRDNAQGEYYLPQLIDLASRDEALVEAVYAEGAGESLLGANSPSELVRNENILRQRIVQYWLEQGVILRNPEQITIGPRVEMEAGAEIVGPSEIYGSSRVGRGSLIESHVHVRDAYIGREAWIRGFSHLEGAELQDRTEAGPYARLRSGAILQEGSKVGNYVEVKKATLGPGSKANHLAYIGDAEVGSGANIGAGCITCNFDGSKNHRTVIGRDAFIGSNASLVAPVEIGDYAVVGAGSTITKNVPANSLAVDRSKQKNLERKGPKKG